MPLVFCLREDCVNNQGSSLQTEWDSCGSASCPLARTDFGCWIMHLILVVWFFCVLLNVHTDVDKIVGTLPLKEEKATMVTEIT